VELRGWPLEGIQAWNGIIVARRWATPGTVQNPCGDNAALLVPAIQQAGLLPVPEELVGSAVAVRHDRRQGQVQPSPSLLPGVDVLVPLCGVEPLVANRPNWPDRVCRREPDASHTIRRIAKVIQRAVPGAAPFGKDCGWRDQQNGNHAPAHGCDGRRNDVQRPMRMQRHPQNVITPCSRLMGTRSRPRLSARTMSNAAVSAATRGSWGAVAHW